MSSVITDAFQKWNADKILENKPAVADKIVFALIQNQDPEAEISPSEGMPKPSEIVDSFDFTRIAKLGDNAVVYSIILDTTVGDWEYNWVGLIDSKTNTVLMITHTDTQKKLKTFNGRQGNSIIRNLVMEFSGASEATQITVTPETWQIDIEKKFNDFEHDIDIKMMGKVDKADITQELGTSKEKVTSQALLTESLADVERDMRDKVDKSQITQELGSSTEKITSQKLLTESLKESAKTTQESLINLIYPVGVVMWFAQNKNPNALIPNTEWKYIGENKTVRLANQNGNNILAVGGADSIKLSEQQIPAHKHSLNATTSSFDYGTKTTNEAGKHTHEFKGSAVTYGKGESTVSPEGYRDKTSHVDEAGAHTHSVQIGAHTHTIEGNTSSVGESKDINITNSYIMLMGWYRTK
ncbi:phage tail protein [Providencia manganoxydans]|uniref:phage tail-collar fiber domain-containing protein n=1 Tax=Providencia manganoxydans TaxID=2923283 RepID=UPI0032DB68C9